MAWIKTISAAEADEKLAASIEAQRALYPPEYGLPTALSAQGESVVLTHSLIPEALHHAFATLGVLLSPHLPLSRRQHEMITTLVSVTNRCHY